MNKTIAKSKGRISRHKRIRARVSGTALRPRLAVYKSNRYIHAQLIDDAKGATLAAGSTREWQKLKTGEAVEKLGQELAKRAKEKGVGEAVFDRGGFRYSGSVAVFAEAARKGGLKF